MALVADYWSSDEEEGEEASQQDEKQEKQPSPTKVEAPSSSSSTKVPSSTVAFYEEDSSEGEEEPSFSLSLSLDSKLGKFLPKPKITSDSNEEEVEIGPIPPKKIYGDEEVPKPPSTSTYHNIATQKVKGVVRIAAPSLKDFKEEDKEEGNGRRFTQASKKGSGLFAILPQPRGGMLSAEEPVNFLKKPNASSSTATPSSSSASSSAGKPSLPRSLIPDSVKNLGKRPPPSKLDEIRAKYLKKEANVVIVNRSGKINEEKVSARDSDDSEEEDAPNFFSFNSGTEEIDDEMLEKLKLPAPDSSQAPSSTMGEEEEEEVNNEATIIRAPVPQEDIMKYVQKKKGKGAAPELNIIDVKADDLRPDTTEWIKNITDKSAVPVRRGKGLGGMQKRKHQITYLAVEAKAREEELQQQWAQNRQTRRQTQMKYGF